MPRGKKQPPRAAQGLPYGQGQALAEAQRLIPLPDNRGVDKPPPAASPGPAAPSPGGAPAVDPLEAVIAQAAAMPNATGSLADPTTRPNVPITNGLSSGPGAGPEALRQSRQQRASVAQFFALAAEVFGNDPVIAEMAQRARMRGL